VDLHAETGLEGLTLSGYSQSESESAAAAASTWAPETTEQMQSPTFQAGKIGFVTGAWVSPKRSDGNMDIWQINSIDDVAGVKMTKHAVDTTNTLTVQSLLEEWRLHKGKVTIAMPGYNPGDCSPAQSEPWAMECIKGAIATALKHEFVKTEEQNLKLNLSVNPYMVTAAADFRPGELKLIPASMRVEKKSGPHAIGLGAYNLANDKQVAMYLMPQLTPPLGKDGRPNKVPWVAPFWAVRQVETQKQACMKLEYMQVTVLDVQVHVPYLTNKVAVHTGDELTWQSCKSPPEPQGTVAKRARK
jgi:hypothetical protein